MSNIVITSSTNSNANIKSNNIKASTTGKGDRGYSAYEIAQKNGFDGTEEEWLASLKGDNFEYDDFTEEQLKELIGPTGPSNILTIGEVKKGDEAAATITGNSPNQILNLILPKGDKGDNPKSIAEQTGSSLTIEASEYNAKEFKIDGKSEQETSVQGKNYFTGNKISNGTGLGITYNFDNSIIKLNGTSTASAIIMDGFTKITLSAGTYTYYLGLKSGSFTLNGKDLAIYLRSSDAFITGSAATSGNTLGAIASTGSTKNTFTITEEKDLYIRIFVNGAGLVCEDLELYLQIEQGSSYTGFEQFTPNSPSPDYPSEIKTVKGIENLIDLLKLNQSGTEQATLNEKTSNTLTYTTTAFSSSMVYGRIFFDTSTIIDSSKNYTLSLKVKSSVAGGFEFGWLGCSKKMYKDISANTITNISYSTNGITTNALSFMMYVPNAKVEIIDIQLEEGLVAHDYVPYGRWTKVKITGKNIFNEKLENGSFNISTGLPISSTAVRRNVNIIPVQPNTTYVISKNLTKLNIRYFYYDKDKNFISTIVSNDTFTTPSNCYYINFISDAISLNDKLQLEKGTKTTEYEAYKENEVLIDLQGNELSSIGDTKDTLEVVSGTLTKNIGKVVLDGSESWAYIADKNGVTLSNYVTVGSPYALSSHYVCANTWTTWTGNNKFGFNTSSVLWVQFNDDFTTVDEFKTFLQEQYNNGTPVVIEYELATPETIELEKNNVPLLEGVNNITLVEDLETDLYVKYYTMFKGNKGEIEERDPIGTIKLYIGSAAPEGYLFCDGSEQSRNVYPELYDIIGTDYQVSAELFLVPNMTESRPTATGTSSAITNYINYIIKAK